MSGTERYQVEVHPSIDAVWCWYVHRCADGDGHRGYARELVADGHCPYESTARRCADAVVSVLSGDGRNMYVDAMCKRDEAIAERDALRAKLERVREAVSAMADRISGGVDINGAFLAGKLRALLDEADHD